MNDINEEKEQFKIDKNYNVDLFSSIQNTDLANNYDMLQDKLRSLNHNVGLLRYYASGNGKLSLKKIKNIKNKTVKRRMSIRIPVNNFKFTSKNKIKNTLDLNFNKPNNTNDFKKFNYTKTETNNISTKANNTATAHILTHTNFNSTPKEEFTNTFTNNISSNRKPHFLFTQTNIKKIPKNSSSLKNTISSERSPEKYNFKKKLNNFTNSGSSKKFFENFPSIITPKIKMIRTQSTNIKNNINIGKKNLISAKWYMNARFKYTEYKYGIAEIQKYFMDIKEFGKPEEDEINKRKTFFDFAEETIEELNKEKYQKQFESTTQKYGIDIKPKDLNDEEKRKMINKILSSKKMILNKKSIAETEEKEKLISLSKVLGEVAERQKNEKIKRDKIKKLILKCKNEVGLMNHFHNESMRAKHKA